ncbi:MAG: glycine zipper domain-containing protein [Desulfatitalea sp.]
MKRTAYVSWVAIVGISIAGCMSPQGRPDYTASGALAGGATGAIVGSMARHPGPGALVGGSVGAVIGGLIGHGMDQTQEAQLRAQAPQTLRRVEQGQPLTVVDVQGFIYRTVMDLPLDEPTQAAQRYVALTAEQVQAVFAKWLRPRDWVQVSEGPATATAS